LEIIAYSIVESQLQQLLLTKVAVALFVLRSKFCLPVRFAKIMPFASYNAGYKGDYLSNVNYSYYCCEASLCHRPLFFENP